MICDRKSVHVYVSENVLEMDNSLIAIFIKYISYTIYYSACTCILSNFGANLKAHKKSNFDLNQLKFSMQHKYMYMHQKM